MFSYQISQDRVNLSISQQVRIDFTEDVGFNLVTDQCTLQIIWIQQLQPYTNNKYTLATD